MSEQLLQLMRVNAYQVYRACLVGNPAPYVANLFNRISKPKRGDLVMEITTFRMNGQNIAESTGRLVDYNGTDKWIISLEFDPLKPGREFKWENAQFITILEEVQS